MLKKKVFIVPAILVTMNATSVFAGKDIATMPAQEAVSGHATTGEKTVTIPAEFETITAKSQSDTSESKGVVPAEYQAIVIRPASERIETIPAK
ncbi:MAG: hypothetical protein CDV28_13513 [Candidatus Electronema aureum]|uniref:Uncharacterized protein n=1 Tax=Candidatus Electronema aureum TaxID=2005002 RepID=A0A521FZL6_9BACT|nr:MAG: hypothetical protein CDV28_13513 [Candidatus Electronema aureum]